MSERLHQVVVAGHTGDADTARGATDDPDPAVRAAALGALDRVGDLDGGDLERALDDPDPAVRRRAVELAASRPEVDLGPALDDPDPTVVEVAAWACGEQHERRDDVDGPTVARLSVLAIEATDPLVREAAAAALGAIGDERGLPAILRACTDKPHVRRRAVLALAPFDGPDVDAAIERALTDRDWQVRQAAEDLRRAAGEHDV